MCGLTRLEVQISDIKEILATISTSDNAVDIAIVEDKLDTIVGDLIDKSEPYDTETRSL